MSGSDNLEQVQELAAVAEPGLENQAQHSHIHSLTRTQLTEGERGRERGQGRNKKILFSIVAVTNPINLVI